MTRIAVPVLLLCCLAPIWAAQPAPEQARPISAAEAEKRVADTREVLIDLLWVGTEPYWHSGRWEECARLCRQVIEVDGSFVEAYTSLGWLLWSHDQDQEAIKVYQQGIAANPESWQARHDFGMYYFGRRKYEEAAGQFRHSVALGAPIPEAHMLPLSLEKAGQKQEALKEWRALLKRFPDDSTAKRRAEALDKELQSSAKGKT